MNRRGRIRYLSLAFLVIAAAGLRVPTLAAVSAPQHDGQTREISEEGEGVTQADPGDREVEHIRADAGTIDLLGTDHLARHRFTLTNNAQTSVGVQSVTRTCKCVVTDLQDGIVIPAGQSHAFEVAFEVMNGGWSAQSVFVTLDSGRVIKYELTAFGINGATAKIILLEAPRQARPKNVRARLWMVDPTCSVGQDVPSLSSPEGAAAQWSTWTVLDRGDRSLNRARRQSIDFILDLEHFEGHYPVQISIQVPGVGAVTKQLIPPPRDFSTIVGR